MFRDDLSLLPRCTYLRRAGGVHRRDLLASRGAIRVWSAGCASGEEAYSVAMLSPRVSVIATDRDEAVLARAARAEYSASSFRELPAPLRRFVDGGVVSDEIRARVRFEQADVRTYDPPRPLDIVLCRNVVFTYFDEKTQRAFAERVASMLVAGGILVVGKGEVAALSAFRQMFALSIQRGFAVVPS